MTKSINLTNTREEWLMNGAARLAPLLEAQEAPLALGKVRVSVGFPKYGRPRAIGQCWSPECAEDKSSNIFLHPTLVDGILVLGTLLHELVHAAVGVKEKHRGKFRKVALGVGLSGKMTATVVAEGSPLHAALTVMLGALGPYPHAALVPTQRSRDREPNLLKFESAGERGFYAYVTRKVLALHGPPHDALGFPMEQVG